MIKIGNETHLQNIINERSDLNDLDVSGITDMKDVFKRSMVI